VPPLVISSAAAAAAAAAFERKRYSGVKRPSHPEFKCVAHFALRCQYSSGNKMDTYMCV
jgi:hypothetical protein